MKTTGVSDIPKFGLLDFLGHPNIYILCHQQQSIMSDLVQCDDDDQVEGSCGD